MANDICIEYGTAYEVLKDVNSKRSERILAESAMVSLANKGHEKAMIYVIDNLLDSVPDVDSLLKVYPEKIRAEYCNRISQKLFQEESELKANKYAIEAVKLGNYKLLWRCFGDELFEVLDNLNPEDYSLKESVQFLRKYIATNRD